MLGLNSNKKPIKGEFAKKIREAAWRAATHNYNDEDVKAIAERKKLEKEYTDTWDLSRLGV